MIRKISASAIVCALFAIGMTAHAQGRPAGAGSQGGGGRPAMSQQQDRMAARQEADARRQQAAARRQAQEEARLAAEAAHAEGPPADAVDKRAMGEAHNMSGDTPSGRQAPNEHAAPEAFLAEGNADNADSQGASRNVTGVTQRDADTRVEGDDNEPDDD